MNLINLYFNFLEIRKSLLKEHEKFINRKLNFFKFKEIWIEDTNKLDDIYEKMSSIASKEDAKKVTEVYMLRRKIYLDDLMDMSKCKPARAATFDMPSKEVIRIRPTIPITKKKRTWSYND